MSFWTLKSFEPKTKSKFIVNLGGDFFITVKSVTKPKLTIETQEYRMINHFYKFPTLAKWEPIELILIDAFGEKQEGESFNDKQSTNTAAFLSALANKIGYVGNDHQSFDENAGSFSSKYSVESLDSISKEASALAFTSNGSSGDPIIKIQQLNSEGKVIEEWSIFNPVIKSLEWGDLQYGSDDVVEYKLSLEYDYAKFKSGDGTEKPTQGGNSTNIYN
tara:strand:- start:1619 stop:2275 length:657 start_codon:yes stop_codon:yes gene_type:complete